MASAADSFRRTGRSSLGGHPGDRDEGVIAVRHRVHFPRPDVAAVQVVHGADVTAVRADGLDAIFDGVVLRESRGG
jgi:propanediol utilization protein